VNFKTILYIFLFITVTKSYIKLDSKRRNIRLYGEHIPVISGKIGEKSSENSRRELDMKKSAYFLVIFAAILWGTVGFLGKKLSEFGFDTFQIVAIRAMSASLVLILYLLFTNKKLLNIKLRDSIYFVGTGIFSFVFFNWCYFVAINNTSLSVAAILLYTAPTIVMIFSIILFKEKLTTKKIVSLILTFVGCALVTIFVGKGVQNISLIGILAGLGSGLGYALYSIFGRYALKKYDSITVTVYTFIFASIGLIPLTDLKGMFPLFSNATAICYAMSLGLFATVLPFLLYTKGLTHLESSKASMIATLEPIVATIIGIIMYQEPVTLSKSVGILLVIFAIGNLREKITSEIDLSDNIEKFT